LGSGAIFLLYSRDILPCNKSTIGSAKMPKTTMKSEALTGYQAPALQKAFNLLRKVAETKDPLSLTDLSRQLGYSKSTTHGLVHALLREGALVQGPDGHKLYIGPTLVDLVFSSWNYLRMVKTVQPTLETLRDQISETVVLGALICNRILIIAAAESKDPLKISASPGTILPLFTGATGKVLLSDKTPENIRELIRKEGLPQHTSRSVTEEEMYLAQLEEARKKGYSVDYEEYLSGVRAVAVAIKNLQGPPMAIWVVGLSSNLGTPVIEKAIQTMTTMAPKLRGMIDRTTKI
jgi:DNA-binding IclR family transcriptional regulator